MLGVEDGVEEGEDSGVLKAPVLCCCSFSKSSCSSFGRRGGAGPLPNEVVWRVEMLKLRIESARRERRRGKPVIAPCIVKAFRDMDLV
jgi:hypothetical protein